jgi:manganese transport protein
LLFRIPLLPAGLLTGGITFALLAMRTASYRRFELAVAGLLGVIDISFLYETFRIRPSATGSLGGLVPSLAGANSLYLALAIIGATVMPHVVYLHSALTSDRMPCREERERSRLVAFGRLDVILALGMAGAVNVAMLAVSARLFHNPAFSGLDSLSRAHAALTRLAGGAAGLAFSVALLASGMSSSSVGTYAGQAIMTGFTGFRVPLAARRAITMIPALAILAAGASPTDALVLSQVLLSFGIPFALVPLALLTSRRDIMGGHRNRRITGTLAWASVILISSLNIVLLVHQFLAS